MQDRYENYATSFDGPANHGFAVTPNDATDLAEITRAVYVGGGGALAVVLNSSAELVLLNVAAGALLPLRARRVKATGTTATGIVGLV